jgi:hypothetical protein
MEPEEDRACDSCYSKDICYVMSKVQFSPIKTIREIFVNFSLFCTKIKNEPIPPRLESKFREVSPISSEEKEFIKKWEEMITCEEAEASDVLRYRQNGEERERTGTCVIIVNFP